MNEEIKEFVEFRTDEDGTYFYYNDKDNVEQWSYKLDDLKDYIINLQQENARLKDKIDKAVEYIKTNCKEWENDDYDVTLYYSLNQNECDELLEILKEN